MYIVCNTKELEERLDWKTMPETEQVMVLGGMLGKDKYNHQKYSNRITYTVGQLRQIIDVMHEIEESIPKSWNQWQRAKYIYKLLGEHISYNMDAAMGRLKYDNETAQPFNPSSLSILMSKQGICAGYSLLYKEMMDRQGIECDYVRGVVPHTNGKPEKHAWNILCIDGISFPVDLTWDSDGLQSGRQRLEFFGNNRDFASEHNPDKDERARNLKTLSYDYVDSIDIDNPNERKIDYKKEQKIKAIKLAIRSTYEKYAIQEGPVKAKERVRNAIRKYINTGAIEGFTRQNGGRQAIGEHVTANEMQDLLVELYVNGIENIEDASPLRHGVMEQIKKYSLQDAVIAVQNYIRDGNVAWFTRQGNARQVIESNLNPRKIMEIVINSITNELCYGISSMSGPKTSFTASELSGIYCPEELCLRAEKWIADVGRMNEGDAQKLGGNGRVDQDQRENER